MKNSISNLLMKLSSEEQLFIAERISYLRQDVLHLTQAQFASALDVSQTYLSQIENKKKVVSSTLIYKISSTFNVRLEWLLVDTDNDNIFQSDKEIIQYSISVKQEEAFHSLCSAFNLQKSNIDFLRWYLSISDEERAGIQQAISFFRKLE